MGILAANVMVMERSENEELDHIVVVGEDLGILVDGSLVVKEVGCDDKGSLRGHMAAYQECGMTLSAGSGGGVICCLIINRK